MDKINITSNQTFQIKKCRHCLEKLRFIFYYLAIFFFIFSWQSIEAEEPNASLFIEKNGTAIERPVILGTIIKDEVQVFAGLQSGENLIITGHHYLTDKEAIRVVNHTKQKK